MAKFKVIVSEPEGKSKVVELEGARAVPLIGKKLGETIDSSVVGMAGKQLLITGGSDKDGFPMRRDVHGGVRVHVVVSKGVGFSPKREGERQRKTLRGNVITEEIVQVNMKALEKTEKEKAKKSEKVEKPRKPRKMKKEHTEEQVEEDKPKEAKGTETAEAQ
jgi:small subunit ribosomal protein S6e